AILSSFGDFRPDGLRRESLRRDRLAVVPDVTFSMSDFSCDVTGSLYRRCIADVRRLYRLYRGPSNASEFAARDGRPRYRRYTLPAAATSVRYRSSLKMSASQAAACTGLEGAP